jgi:hypothetical protein
MLFKILHGDPSNISLDITPFHEGWAYVTHDGFFYIDLNIGTVEVPNNQRIKLNAASAEMIDGLSLDEIKASIVVPSTRVTHGETLLSNIIETYILTVDYDALLAFDTSELVIGATTTSVLGQAILGQMVLA